MGTRKTRSRAPTDGPASGTASKAVAVAKSRSAAARKHPTSARAVPKGKGGLAKSTVKIEEDELPHNLGPLKPNASSQSPKSSSAKDRRVSSKKKTALSEIIKNEDVQSMAAKVANTAPDSKITSPSKGTPKKSKANEKNKGYGLTPGQSPYPDWPHPTPEECHEVTRLLSDLHGEVKAPESIPVPSLTASGCGEVPSVLDALIRTRLSAATSNKNSSRAFQGLVERFGILESGVGKGSVNWDAVRLAAVGDIYEAIKSGGLADVKSKDIKQILQMVYDENQARKDTLLAAPKSEQKPDIKAEKESSADEKEVARAEENVLSLDHLHSLSSDEAFDELIKYPGIGPKTASCVLLFCLQRPSFAVDTHVFRLCKWLGWVPPDSATRNNTYAHCDVRIPDELKYPLHVLFIKHGRTCGRCRAITGEGSADWNKGCPIDHLVKRSGVRKGGEDASPTKKSPGKKSAAKKSSGTKRKRGKQDSDSESREATDVETDEDAEILAAPARTAGRRNQPARKSARRVTVTRESSLSGSDMSDAGSEEYVD